MVDKRLVDYINSSLKAGYTKEQIKYVLLKEGWPEGDVDQALGTVEEVKKPQKEPEKPRKEKAVEPTGESHKKIYIIGALFIIAIMAGAGFYIMYIVDIQLMGLSEGRCGNGVCDAEESFESCPSDCEEISGNASAAKTTFSVSPADQNVSNGDSFTVEIRVSNAKDLYGFQLDVEYDSNILQYDGIKQGSFLSKNVEGTTYPLLPKVSPGLLKYIAGTKLGEVSGSNGEGTLEILTFIALNTGTSQINISNAKPINSKVKETEAVVKNGKVTVL